MAERDIRATIRMRGESNDGRLPTFFPSLAVTDLSCSKVDPFPRYPNNPRQQPKSSATRRVSTAGNSQWSALSRMAAQEASCIGALVNCGLWMEPSVSAAP